MGLFEKMSEMRAQREERKEIRDALDLSNDKFW